MCVKTILNNEMYNRMKSLKATRVYAICHAQLRACACIIISVASEKALAGDEATIHFDDAHRHL